MPLQFPLEWVINSLESDFGKSARVEGAEAMLVASDDPFLVETDVEQSAIAETGKNKRSA